MSEFNPSVVTIERAMITSYDGKAYQDISTNFIVGFEIVQSMSSVAWKGTLDIMDAVGILETFPLRGEETLELDLRGNDLNTEVKLKAKIHKVTDIKPASSSSYITYKIHFISATSFEASRHVITRAYKTSVNQIAKEIFNEFFSPLGQTLYTDPEIPRRVLPMATSRSKITAEQDREFYLQPTVGILNIIIPFLTPTEAMFFIAARAFNGESPSQTFRFFETLENFYFCTDEFFLKDIRDAQVIDLFYAPVPSVSVEDADGQIQRVETIQILSRGIDTSTDMFSGAYRNEVVEMDLIRRRLEINKFNFDDAEYVDMTGNRRDMSANPHTPEFRQDMFTDNNARRLMFVRNYTRPGDGRSALNADLHFSEIAQNRISYYHHLNNVVIQAGMKGRLDIRPGMVVNLDMKEFSGTESSSRTNTLSGRYLVNSTVHSKSGDDTLYTNLTLVKFDWSGMANTRSAEQPEITA